MPSYYPPSGGGITTPVGIADGGTGATSRAAAIAALYGWEDPPLTGWTSWGSPSVAEVHTDGRSYRVGKALSASDAAFGAYRSLESGARRVEMWLAQGTDFGAYPTFGMVLIGSDGASGAVAIIGRTWSAGLSSADRKPYTAKATGAGLTSRGDITWATYGGTQPDVMWPEGDVFGLAFERSSGGACTIQVRGVLGQEWTTFGTTANDAAAFGLTGGVESIGFWHGEYDFNNLRRGRVASAYLVGWSET